MNVQVKHNGTNITGFVESYEREHKICTGIGTLRVEIVRTINRTFDPWDEIDIHENGDFKVRYYISSTTDNIPKGTITLDCQDISKRLVDYFIPDSYTIDYPSYTRYWIEKFLAEAGISFTFNTSSQGNLISNNTQLGLQPAYEQILTLLQMSGWFIYFNESEEAVIGPLDAELAIANRSVGKSDILEISRNSDDKMLRNRALVLGAFDVFSMSYSTADVVVHTRWNYDHNDVRAIVVSNSNIPNKGSAFGIANMLIKEFARITVEKHITLWGARDYNLGDAIRVNTKVWRGKGLITTFGTSMSKQGLVTRLILDERCPRLFGFFDFGDYVYVGTYGDGIWKKHIKFDPTWYNFSSGLTNLNITDLHVNNGVFGSVAASGEMYITFEEGGWNPISVTGLMSSADDVVPSGQAVNYVGFSGIMGRATIVDKIANTVKFAVDTFSGINMGDYFLDNYPSGVLFSGMVTSSGNRGWILEYDPFTLQLVGGLGSGIYPISYSGDYNVTVLDLENDGINDYVSVAMSSGIILTYEDGYDFGSHTSIPKESVRDYDSSVAYSNLDYDEEGETLYQTLSTQINPVFSVFNNEIEDERDIVYYDEAVARFKRSHFYKEFNISLGRFEVLETTEQSPSQSGTGLGTLDAISKESDGVYKVFHSSFSGSTEAGTFTFKVRTWDIGAGTVSSDTTLGSLTTTNDPLKTSAREGIASQRIVMGGVIYFYVVHGGKADSAGFGGSDVNNYSEIYRATIDLETNSFTSGLLTTIDFEDRASPNLWNADAMNSSQGTSGAPLPMGKWLFQKENTPFIAFFIREWTNPFISSSTILRNWLIKSEDGVAFQKILVQETTTGSDSDYLYIADGTTVATQQVHEKAPFVYMRALSTIGGKRIAYAYNGETVYIRDHVSGVPHYCVDDNNYATFGSLREEYLSFDGSNWWIIDIATILPLISLSFPSGYTITRPFSTSSPFVEQFYWYATRISDSRKVILILNRAAVLEGVINPFSQPNLQASRAIVAGNFFLDVIDSSNNDLRVLYVDNIFPPTEGGTFLVLQRDGSDFNLIEREAYPIRIDISNNSPILAVGSGEGTFVSNFVYDTTLEQIIFASGEPIRVDDYRYTFLEATFSGISASGLAAMPMGLYVSGSGIFAGDITTYSGGFQQLYEVPSGYGQRIETSNYGIGGQYIFVTTSGDVTLFYQLDPGQYSFTLYSGLPASRATIIRLDDRI